MELLRLADLSKAAVQNRHTEADFWNFQACCTAYFCMAVFFILPFLAKELGLSCSMRGFEVRICTTGSPLHALSANLSW